mmetsp:Transcript_58856/g.139034  ORF Transcript_58856/g.139034 Transcript_58856/m.139034 type:complete len:703 (+) Transcript_58856:71-2179(+)
MGEEVPSGGVTKSGAKTAKSDAQKFSKRRPDPAGLAKLEEGDAALKAGDFTAAKALFDQAADICKNSSVTGEKKAKEPKEAKPAADAEPAVEPMRLYLSNPKDNLQAKPMREGVDEKENYAKNTPELLAEHLKVTGGKYITRFPPEPNGYLHIGHAKAMNFNFGQANIAKEQGFGGETIMRFDDTNPEAEKQEYIDSILSNVHWLGNKPCRVTYSSDYFQQLYDFAVQLIKQGDAYVCHQTKDQLRAGRDALRAGRAELPPCTSPPPLAVSPWRSTTVEENLAKFEKMRTGQYAEGEAFLRMKGELMSDNPAMWDTAFYRIKYSIHPHSGDKWCIYPTYDYTHCICDSLENITHSLCTLEFETRQAADGPYYWLLYKLGIYRPVTWEYSRCNITHNVLSKRKLNSLVTKGIASGWDDPRLLTLDGLRRRGYTPLAINAFCEQIGVTRAGSITTAMHVLENCIRNELDVTANRAFAVLKPLKVMVTDMDGPETVTVPNHPKDLARGSRALTLSSTIFIELTDFRPVDDPNFFGLAPGKDVGLLGTSFLLHCTSFDKGADGAPALLHCKLKERGDAKPKGNLHWLSESTAVAAEVRLYQQLFTVENPNVTAVAKPSESAAAAPDGEEGAEDDEDEGPASWINLINPTSMVTEGKALVEPSLAEFFTSPGTSFQFQRLGFFTVDLASTKERPVLNRVVGLKQGAF